ncbi:hypothetical protein E2C01_001037 [Portunus trituberculatus]|uniref:Uncharacterized protein n=1 Tax=Portunus trituberculatus TaxID=210409 RepID=A0A5B7CGL5_PORTR|nr:hypothetical protein [Portunus trituberculatus]
MERERSLNKRRLLEPLRDTISLKELNILMWLIRHCHLDKAAVGVIHKVSPGSTPSCPRGVSKLMPVWFCCAGEGAYQKDLKKNNEYH